MTLEGADRMEQELARFVVRSTDAGKKALKQGAETVLKSQRDTLNDTGQHPYSTGDLASRLEVKSMSGAMKIGAIGVNAAEACWVEFGHGGPHPAGAHPFMEPAYLAVKDEVTDGIAQAVKEALGL